MNREELFQQKHLPWIEPPGCDLTERQVALRLVRLQGAPSLLDLVETGRLAAAAVLHSERGKAPFRVV